MVRTQTALCLVVFLAFGTLGAALAQEGSHTATSKAVFNGADPVLLAKGKTAKGNPTLSLTHDGFTYYFSSQQTLSEFKKSPEKFAVQDHGYCPVAKVMMNQEVKGKPEIYAVHDGKAYLFLDEEAKKMFEKTPSRFVGKNSSKPAPKEGSGI